MSGVFFAYSWVLEYTDYTMEKVDCAQLAPAYISAVGAIVGVVVGAVITYLLERKAERDRRDRDAAHGVIDEMGALLSLLYAVLNPVTTNPSTFRGEPLYAETVVNLARRVEKHAYGFADANEREKISTILRQKYPDRLALLNSLSSKWTSLALEYRPAISGVQKREADESFDGPGNAVYLPRADEEYTEDWPGIAYKEFAQVLHERTGLPRLKDGRREAN